jgi:hypothetical protein
MVDNLFIVIEKIFFQNYNASWNMIIILTNLQNNRKQISPLFILSYKIVLKFKKWLEIKFITFSPLGIQLH